MKQDYQPSSSYSVKSYINTDVVLDTLKTNPFQITIQTSLKQFQRFLERYCFEPQQPNGNHDIETKIDEWRPLLKALQLTIDKREEVQISHNGTLQNIVDSEESFANEFSKLIHFIRKPYMEDEGCGVRGELRSQKFIYNYSNSNIQADRYLYSSVSLFCPREAHENAHPDKHLTCMADTALELKKKPAATNTIRDLHHSRTTQFHMCHEASLLFSYAQEYKKLQNAKSNAEIENETQVERPIWDSIQQNTHPLITSLQVAGPFINISSAVLLPWPLAQSLHPRQSTGTEAKTYIDMLLPIVLSFYFLQRKLNDKKIEGIDDINAFYEEWDSEIGELGQPQTRVLLCKWVTGSSNPLRGKIGEPEVVEKHEKSQKNVLSPKALINSVVSFCVLSFGIPHRNYSLPWLFDLAKTAYDTIKNADEQDRIQATENAQKTLAKSLILHVLVVFDHELHPQQAHIPCPNKNKDKEMFIKKNGRGPRFYPYLKPSPSQRSFIRVSHGSTIDDKVVMSVCKGMENILGFLFSRTASTVRMLDRYRQENELGQEQSNTNAPMILRTQILSKGSRTVIMKLFRSNQTLVIKSNVDSTANFEELTTLQKVNGFHENVVPIVYVAYNSQFSFAMEDIGEPLSSFAFGTPFIEGISHEQYENTFINSLLPDAFIKLEKLLDSGLSTDVLGDIKPGNLMKRAWSDKDLKFIDFETEMATWKYAAPEILLGECDTKTPIWGLALSLLSLVLDLDNTKLPGMVRSEGGKEAGSPNDKYNELIALWTEKGLLCDERKYLLVDQIGTWKEGLSEKFRRRAKDLLQPCLAIFGNNRSYDALRALSE